MLNSIFHFHIIIIFFLGFHKSVGVLRLATEEPNAPSIQTEIPGPKSKTLFNELSTVQVKGHLIYKKNHYELSPITSA